MTYHLDLLERPSKAIESRRSDNSFQFMPRPPVPPALVPDRRRLRRKYRTTAAVPFRSNLETGATLAGASSILLLQVMMLGLLFLSL